MTSSLSPDQYGKQPSQGQYGGGSGGGGGSGSDQERGPLSSLNLGFLKSLTEKRTTRELYIKALEDEVLRLKEIFSNISQDKDKIAEENRQLKQLLVQNGIPLSHYGDDMVSNPSVGYTSSASQSGHSYGQNAYTPPLTSTTAPSVSPSSHDGQPAAAKQAAWAEFWQRCGL
ncbi:BZIP-type transcription factor [Colletotrichum higginsianum]|nr:BZIP-type transcription factor [Colletotrichum higginsianum]